MATFKMDTRVDSHVAEEIHEAWLSRTRVLIERNPTFRVTPSAQYHLTQLISPHKTALEDLVGFVYWDFTLRANQSGGRILEAYLNVAWDRSEQPRLAYECKRTNANEGFFIIFNQPSFDALIRSGFDKSPDTATLDWDKVKKAFVMEQCRDSRRSRRKHRTYVKVNS